MRKKYKLKKKFVSFLLIYFVFLTFYSSVITLSKYVGTITGSANSTIAKWEASTDTSENGSNTLNMTIGDDVTNTSYILKITSTSEVKAIYSIVLSNVPSSIKVKLDNGPLNTPINNTVEFNNVGYINADADNENKTKRHTLTFNAPLDIDEINNSVIDIDVLFEQVMPEEN